LIGCGAAATLNIQSIANRWAGMTTVIDYALEFVTLVLVIYVLMSWFIGYRVIGYDNSWVRAAYVRLAKLLDPVLRPIRRILPDTGDIDLSPVPLIVLILTVRYAIQLYPMA
jgi:YggT family protein